MNETVQLAIAALVGGCLGGCCGSTAGTVVLILFAVATRRWLKSRRKAIPAPEVFK